MVAQTASRLQTVWDVTRSVPPEWTRVIDVTLYLDGLKLSVTKRAKPMLVRFSDPRNVEVVGGVVSRLMNKA